KQIEMDILQQQIGGHNRLFAEMVDDGGIVADPYQRRNVLYLDVGREMFDQAEFPYGRDLCPVIAHILALYRRCITGLLDPPAFSRPVSSKGAMSSVHHIDQLVVDISVAGNDMRLVGGI